MMLCYNYTVELALLPFGLFFKRAWERGYSRVCLINSVMCVYVCNEQYLQVRTFGTQLY